MKTALVTGANKGIGLEVVRQLLEKDFRVILTSRNKAKGIEATNRLKSFGDNVIFLQLDVESESSIQEAAVQLKKDNIKLDVLVNNAGVLLDSDDLTITSKEKIISTFMINTLGPIMVVQHFLPLFNKSGRVINVSSGLGALSEMSNYAPSYSISKTALNAVTKQFSFSLEERNISVNSVSPGWVKTDMGGDGAPRSVQKGAETIIWLATEASQEITGKFFRDKKEIDW